MDVNITIDGMGGTINYETIMVTRLFQQLGYEVIVDDDCPFVDRTGMPDSPFYTKETEDEYVERITKLHESRGLRQQPTINIKTVHRPWGG